MARKHEKSFFKELREATAELTAEIKACKAMSTAEPSENDIVIKTYDINQEYLKLEKSVEELNEKLHTRNVQMHNFHADFHDLLFEIDQDTNMLEDFLKQHGYQPDESAVLSPSPKQVQCPDKTIQADEEDDSESDSSQRGSVTPVFISNYEKQLRQREKEKKNLAPGTSLRAVESKESTTPVLAPLNHPKIFEDMASVTKKLEIESDEELEELGKQLDRRMEERKAMHSTFMQQDSLLASPTLNWKQR